MQTDFQISSREYAGASVAANKLNRAAKAFGRRMRRLREIANLSPTELALLMNEQGLRRIDGNGIIDAEMGDELYTTEMAKCALKLLREG